MCWIMAESLLSQNPRLIFFDDNSKIDLLVEQVYGLVLAVSLSSSISRIWAKLPLISSLVLG